MSLPSEVVVGCIEYTVTEPEPGFVVFSEAQGLALGAFKNRYSFTRETVEKLTALRARLEGE